MTKPLLLSLTCALALGACTSEPASNEIAPANVTGNAADIVVPPEDAPAANVAAEETAAAPAVNLAPDELTLVLPDGSARHVPFGTKKAAAMQMIAASLGSPIEQGHLSDCGAGALDFANFRDGLSLYFQDGKFAGWDLDGREKGKFATAAGVGIGSTRAALEAAGPIAMQENSTIGIEFMQGELSGLLSAEGPEGKVTNLWAGVNCIAR